MNPTIAWATRPNIVVCLGPIASMINESRMTPERLNVLFLNTVSKWVYNR